MDQRRIESVQRIPSEMTAIKTLSDRFLSDLKRQGYDEGTTFAIALGFSEALANAFKHGNQRDATKCITVRYRMNAILAEIEVRDEGRGFDPGQVPDAVSQEGQAKP